MTNEERIETVDKLLLEGISDESKSKENFLKICQLETDNIVSAISPHSQEELGFIVFSLEAVLKMVKETMKRHPRQEINYRIIKKLIGTSSLSVEVPKRSKR